MDLPTFRDAVRRYRRPTGQSQKDLAREIGLHPNVLSHKLAGSKGFRLTHQDVKGIVRMLAASQAIARQTEAVELLRLADLDRSAFTDDEWLSPPLSLLDADLPAVGARPLAAPVPIPMTRLVGRAGEVAQVRDLLSDGARLVTLTGVGGTGKTRLALQVAADLHPHFADGVVFANLAALAEPGLVPAAIAHAFGLQEVRGLSLTDQLLAHVRGLGADAASKGREGGGVLLVLDNFEQILPAVPLVGELLAASPYLQVLVTSRVTLRLYGEQEFRVPPLALSDGDATAEQVLATEAVQLFLVRARAARPAFAPRGDAVQAIAEICARLDGLPLAIELAAARSKLFSPRAMLERLSGSAAGSGTSPALSFLRGGAHNLPERQQTLHHTLDWSYRLLEPADQRLFARLGVFAGGIESGGAAAVCESDLDALAGLADQGLLENVPAAAAEPRFRMLETVREYALARLAESGEGQEIRRRHAHFYLHLVEDAVRLPAGEEWAGRLNRLEEEHGNLNVAADWLLAHEFEPAIRMASALFTVLYHEGRLHEGHRRLEKVLERSTAAGEARAQALVTVGNILSMTGDRGRGAALVAEGGALYEREGNLAGVARTLGVMGEEALRDHNYVESRRLRGRALALYRSLSDREGIARAVHDLGITAFYADDPERACPLLGQSITLYDDLGVPYGRAISRVYRAVIAVDEGDSARARELLREALPLVREAEDVSLCARWLAGMALVLAMEGEGECPIRLLSAGQVLLERIGVELPPVYRHRIEPLVAAIEERIDGEAVARARAEGRAMGLGDVLDALEEEAGGAGPDC